MGFRWPAGWQRSPGRRLSPGVVVAADQLVIPDEDSPVIDRAAVLDGAQRQQLVDLLRELKEKTGTQVKVLTVPSLAGEDVFRLPSDTTTSGNWVPKARTKGP